MKQIDQLRTWTRPGVLGFYHSCEVTVCCILNHSQTAFNLFTIFTFESRENIAVEPVFLTSKNEHCGNNHNLALVQYHISIETALTICQQIEDGAEHIETPFGPLQLDHLKPVPSIFVPSDSTLTLPLNRILKNNFRGGSMTLEYFCEKKNIYERVPQKDIKRSALRIRELLPVDIFTISDRIGNVIFQLPEQIAHVQLSGNENSVTCKVIFDNRVPDRSRYCLTMFTEHDHAIMGFASVQGVFKNELSLSVEDTGGPYTITLTDTSYHIPVLQQTTSMMRQLSNIFTIAGSADTVRTIQLPNGYEEHITINSGELISVGAPMLPWENAVNQRHYQRRMEELEHGKEFIQYAKGTSDRVRALADLRVLMNAGPKEEVYLWDPYLTAADLLETWYFTDLFGLMLKAITSNRVYKKDSSSSGLEDWKKTQRDTLRTRSNQIGINIQWRIQHDHFGYSFHDRFLVVIHPKEEPKAWSLGTSLNHMGDTHHILQVVSNPGYIADAFIELWNMLEDESCLIWNSEEERKRRE